MAEVRKYFVKTSWIFNLESMNDKIWCIIYDTQDGVLKFPFEVAGTEINEEDDLFRLKDEVNELERIAKSRKVTGKEYGRIKEIVNWRVNQRYMTCIAKGMSDYQAGACFEDL